MNLGIQLGRQTGYLGTMIGVLLTLAMPAQAQFKLDIEGVAEGAFPKLEVIAPPPKNKNQQGQQVFVANQNINAWLFQRHGNEAQAREFLKQQLNLAIDTIDRDVELTDEQREKLRLAGAGDVSLFFAEVEKIRDEFDGNAMNDPNQFNNVWQRIQPLQQRMRSSLYGPNSIFARVSDGMLEEAQRSRLSEVEQKRLRFHFETHLKNTISQAHRTRPFRTTQRQRIMKLLQDVEMPNRGTRQMTQQYALYSLSKVRSELSEIVSKEQMKALNPLLRRGERMERTLRNEGYIQ